MIQLLASIALWCGPHSLGTMQTTKIQMCRDTLLKCAVVYDKKGVPGPVDDTALTVCFKSVVLKNE